MLDWAVTYIAALIWDAAAVEVASADLQIEFNIQYVEAILSVLLQQFPMFRSDPGSVIF